MEYNGIQFLRPDPFLSEGITFLRHDPDWRPYYIPLQTRLTKRHSRLTPSAFLMTTNGSMKIIKLVDVAQSSLLKNRLRSLLTMLGIVIGVGAVIVMRAIGDGAQKNIEERIQTLGTNLIMVRSSSNSFGGVRRGAGSSRTLTLKDIDIIAEQCSLVVAVSGIVNTNGQVIGGGTNWFTQVQGVSPEFLTIKSWDLEMGTFFTERDIRAKSKVAVLGSSVVENMFSGQEPIGQTLRMAHKLIDGQEDDFSVRTQTEITEAFSATTQQLTVLLMFIAAVSLVVGGVGIMNIMLVSVTERTREIGIRVAVGARSIDVLTQFLIEAVVLSVVGGLLGIASAYGISYFLQVYRDMTTIIKPEIVVISIGVSLVIGIVFGLFPARKASQLDHIDALRHE